MYSMCLKTVFMRTLLNSYYFFGIDCKKCGPFIIFKCHFQKYFIRAWNFLQVYLNFLNVRYYKLIS